MTTPSCPRHRGEHHLAQARLHDICMKLERYCARNGNTPASSPKLLTLLAAGRAQMARVYAGARACPECQALQTRSEVPA